MIGVLGQYLVTFKIGQYSDFISESDLELFKIIEEAGNNIPYFELIFYVYNKKILAFLNQNNILEVSIGINQSQMKNMRLIISSCSQQSTSKENYKVRLTGMYAALNYLYTSRVNSFSGTSIGLIPRIVGKYFRNITNIQTTNDNMTWIQPNQPDRYLVNQLWLRSQLPDNDLMMCGITSDGEFRTKALHKSLESKTTQWKMTNVVTDDPNYISYHSAFTSGSSGLFNYLTGYPKSRIVRNVDTGEINYNTPVMSPMLAITANMDTASIGRRVSKSSISNSNIHPTYHSSYDLNIMRLNALKSLSCKVTVINMFFGIGVLDTVMLKASESNGESSEDISGIWIVSKVARILSSREFTTVITVCRDGMNNISFAKS